MGKIIVIEGIEGSGKETQSKLLVESLNKMGIKSIEFSFPMYDTPTGKIFKEYFLSNNNYFQEGYENLDPELVCLYTAADRKYNINKINKYLSDDYIVVINRYTSSNMANQGSKYEDSEDRFYMYQWIDKLEYWLLQLPKPDQTIFLHMPYQYSLELKKNRKVLDEHERSPEHLKNAEEAYIELSEMYNWKRIECVKDGQIRDVEDINDDILKAIIKVG